MKYTYITLVFSLFSCHLASAATYNIPNDQALNFPDTFGQTTIAPGSKVDNDFFDLDFSDSQPKSRLKRDYLEIIKLLKSQQLVAAEKKINRLVEENPEEADVYQLRATLELLQQKHSRAIKSYQKVIQLAPDNIRANLGLALVYLQSEDLTQAKRYAK